MIPTINNSHDGGNHNTGSYKISSRSSRLQSFRSKEAKINQSNTIDINDTHIADIRQSPINRLNTSSHQITPIPHNQFADGDQPRTQNLSEIMVGQHSRESTDNINMINQAMNGARISARVCHPNDPIDLQNENIQLEESMKRQNSLESADFQPINTSEIEGMRMRDPQHNIS